jgi:hypothetical protein
MVVPHRKLAVVDSLDGRLHQWYAVMNDSTVSDSLKMEAKSKIRELAVQKAKLYPGFQHLMESYPIHHDSLDWKAVTQHVPGLDTLASVFESNPEMLFDLAEKQSIKQFEKYCGAGALPSQFAQTTELKSISGNIKQNYEQYTDTEKLKDQGKEKAITEAIDYFAEHADKLNMSHAKVSKLLNKYRDIANSDDLGKAIKKTSLQGKTFWERLVIGGNFSIVSTDPVCLDLSPQLGFKFTTRFVIGIGMNYRHTFSDTIKSKWYVLPKNTSFSMFSSYEVVKGFVGYAEGEHSDIAGHINDRSLRRWKSNYFIGIGKKISLTSKVYMNTLLLYNLNKQDQNPVHPRRFEIRFGFQLSELVTRKERISYDPNR